MIPKPYKGTYPVTFEFGAPYGGLLGIKLKYHEGIDIGMPISTPIYAPIDAVIKTVNGCETCSSYGKYINLESGKLWLLLAHLSEVLVEKGQFVKAGDLIGRSGMTGKATGPHLHIGVHDLDKFNEPMHDFQNPREYIDFEGVPEPHQPQPPEVATPPLESGGKTYTVQPGDSLWKIAVKFYGRGSQWPRIYEANRDRIDNPSLIYPDQELRIPE